MKNKCALLIGALAIISALLIIPNNKVKAEDYHNCFSAYRNASNYYNVQITEASFNNTTSFTARNSTWVKPVIYYDSSTNVCFVIALSGRTQNYTGSWNNWTKDTSFGGSVFQWTMTYYDIPYFNNFTDANNYSNGLPYNSANIIGGRVPITYDIMPTEKGLKVNGADFSFYSSYSNNKFTIAYNYSLTNNSPSDSSLRIEAGDLLTFELHAKVPTKAYLEAFVSECGLGDATPSTILTYAKSIKDNYSIINNDNYNIPTTEVFGVNYYGYNDGDAVEYDDSFLSINQANDQNGILTFRVTSENNSAQSPNLLGQLVNYYGSERLAILGSAFGYIDYVKSYVINITGTDWRVYNPYYTYFFQIKDDSGRNVKRANNFEGTPQQFTSNDVTNNETVGDFTIPTNNETDIQSSYTGGITNSYNNTYNNYYNSTDANQELLDYLYRYRDGGQQEDIENAYGYLNSTIDSVSNVPVVIGKLFYGFFPPQVILLFNAMFIIFAVFIIIKIIRHLFL